MTRDECERFSRNGSAFYLSSRLYASPIAEQKEAMFAVLKSNGFCEIPKWISAVVSSFKKVSAGILKG